MIDSAIRLCNYSSMNYTTAVEYGTTPEPYEFVLGPGGDMNNSNHWVHVGRHGGLFMHYGADTLHIGVDENGALVCDSRAKEYNKGHIFHGNVPVGDLPVIVFRDGLFESLQDTRIIYAERQQLIRGLAAMIPEVCDIPLDFPKPFNPINMRGNPKREIYVSRARVKAKSDLYRLQRQLFERVIEMPEVS
jgi:hypothetical protein